MGEGRPNGEAHANVSQDTINDQGQWNTGTPKNPGDATTQGIYPDASDENAGDGSETSQAQQVSSTTDPRSDAQGGTDVNPTSFGSMQGGLPASGATTDPEQKADTDKA
ncbi:hypothetical protein [Deinococcus radiotolerans]|uniref:Uncharacterized protein n=1 Tax=Deinococcus radiotolerans TaxID=1309407 RepID=A0ABQ2FQA4_9DEIO|nr:hypothetical protein [Deinococcus radiotolerans]GGL16141.1 hypothetical protein GCM10010844_38770 [Deinococcus radiotolerans]